jgi:hypothetical protein
MLLHDISFLRIFFILSLMWPTNVFGQGMPDVSEKKRLHINKINNPETKFDINRLPVCSRYGCSEISDVSLTIEEWEGVRAIFNSPTLSSVDERVLLSLAIGQMEVIVGTKNNTYGDVGGTFKIYLNLSHGKSDQLDCIDESANTLLYLRVFAQEKLLRWHEVSGLTSRIGFRAGYPHTAVRIIENESNDEYIIDSWFHANGVPAEVISYKLWKKGWKPLKK